MSWWMILIAVFVLLRVTRRRRWERRAFGRWQGGQLGPGGAPPWAQGRSYQEREYATSPQPQPSAPDPRRDLQRTIEAVRQEYVASRITVEEYEQRLDELYRTAEGKRLTNGS